jgi:hypothetical protein
MAVPKPVQTGIPETLLPKKFEVKLEFVMEAIEEVRGSRS